MLDTHRPRRQYLGCSSIEFHATATDSLPPRFGWMSLVKRLIRKNQQSALQGNTFESTDCYSCGEKLRHVDESSKWHKKEPGLESTLKVAKTTVVARRLFRSGCCSTAYLHKATISRGSAEERRKHPLSENVCRWMLKVRGERWARWRKAAETQSADQRWCNREGDVCATRRVFVWMVSFISYNAFRYIVAIFFCCLLNLQLFFLNSCSQRGNNLDMLYNKNALSSGPYGDCDSEVAALRHSTSSGGTNNARRTAVRTANEGATPHQHLHWASSARLVLRSPIGAVLAEAAFY